ncbi:HepT-like ribonuclease domain-containing protein [Microbacterium sp. 22242]|uniref:HepT-like ribonuclease domain-containing protein n=1 Tax=Microbacterium sp. 22242 TaxID=3453896 RepID=UPI003F8645F7
MRREDPERILAILDDIARFGVSAARVVARGREPFFDPDDDDQRRIARSLAVDLSTAADRLPETFRDAHPEINWRGVRGLRNVIAHDYQGTDDEVLWEVLASRFPQILAVLGID